jgi:hypothetical protein
MAGTWLEKRAMSSVGSGLVKDDSAAVLEEEDGAESGRQPGSPPRILCAVGWQCALSTILAANEGLLHGVVRRYLEERSRLVGTDDVRQMIRGFSHARVTVLRENEHLQVWREPLLGN